MASIRGVGKFWTDPSARRAHRGGKPTLNLLKALRHQPRDAPRLGGKVELPAVTTGFKSGYLSAQCLLCKGNPAS